ncbi:STAS domain-containing protein [Paenisporosarcina indica]|uniref:STAS domain-containing protein n=1 Tax=Paenisporosarcina indica TaxID=650093 RepID=UPI000B063D7B|nr:STAS domain-containing protein [Paenisporosarcina indica]
MDEILKVGQYLIDHAEEIISEMMEITLKNVEYEVTDEMIEQSMKLNIAYLILIAESFNESDEKAAEALIAWSKKNGEQQASMLGRLTTLIKPYANQRLMYIQQITKISMSYGLSTENVVKINNRISYLLDVSMTETIFAYEAYRNELMTERQKEINELSAPIVPIQRGIAVLPLIGAIDYERVQHLLNNVLPTIPELEVEHLIIDFSGILTIDSEVAQHIFMVHNVLQLLGIHVMFTGIRPNLSMAVVQAGIDFTSFNTFASVKQAIESVD